jgi:glyoxylase-like metal-dependent hydrolase (beta-lactamase superfamily II)
MAGFAGMNMQLGPLTLRSVIAARIRLAAQAGPHPEVELVARVLVVDGPAGRTLIDAGPDSPAALSRILEEEGISSDSIDRLVLTHLHADHAGGAPIPGRPIHVHERNLAAALEPNHAEGRAYRRADVERVNTPLLVPTRGAEEILPGLRVTVSSGHTPGMQIVWIEGGGETVIASGDLIPTLSHIRLAGSGEYDVDADLLESEKRDLIEEALRRRAWLFFYHDMRHVAVRLGGTPDRPVAVEEVRF